MNVVELRVAADTAERELRFANLRRQWMERRLLEAPDELEFNARLAELSVLEGRIADLALEAARARRAWAQADDEARCAAPR